MRKYILGAIVLCDRTLPAVLDRARDVNEEVRRVVFVTARERMPLALLRYVDRRELSATA